MRDTRPTVWGPTWIESKGRYRVLVVTPTEDGQGRRRSARWFVEEGEAEDFKESITTKLSRFTRVTVSDAIDLYEQHLKDKGTIGYGETIRRLRAFLPQEITIGRVTPERAKAYYESFRTRLRPDKEPISVAYHRAALINVRSFMTWCIEQGWIELNPFSKVKGIGKKNRGKPQLTGDEIIRWYAYCLARARDGDRAALGCLMAFTSALRSGDLCRRIVRDVDMGGTVLRVSGGKTLASNRPRAIARDLQPLVKILVAGRSPDEPLFPRHVKGQIHHHTRRWLEQAMERFCAGAGVPYVCPHSLKGSASSILIEEGYSADAVARHCSHESRSTTEQHYITPGAVEDARQRKALKVMNGGKK